MFESHGCMLRGSHIPALVTCSVALACRPPSEPREVFAQRVVPVLEQHCSAATCHGIGPDSEAVGEQVDWDKLFFEVDEAGTIMDVEGAYEAAKRAIVTTDPARFSSLLRKPLAPAHGGLPHFGKANFRSPRDPGYRAIEHWIETERGGGEDEPPLDALQQQFADTVQPILAGSTCMNANCHGLYSAVPFRLDPGVGGEFSLAATRTNYEASRTMAALGGDPMQARLLRKMLPVHAGGIVHKGGNASFLTGPDDPRVEPIVDWLCAEHAAELGEPCRRSQGSVLDGFVFVRGPLEPGSVFDLDRFTPGSDLYFARVSGDTLTPVDIVNLTAHLHEDPADIRDPAVHHDGRHVVFAMRRSSEQGHSVYELELDTLQSRQLTRPGSRMPGGGLRTDRDPTYGPRGHVWFVSTRAGTVADGGTELDADLYELDPATDTVTRRTFTPHIERKPTFFTVGEEAGGEIGFTALRDAIPAQARAHPFRFPPSLATEYHQHFGITPQETLFHDMRELADGRYVVTIGELEGVWRAGRLGIVDRNFGPELAADEQPALPFYAPPLTRLDPEASSHGPTSSMYRDAVGLPDGRILTARATGALDLDDPAVIPDFGITVLTLQERIDHGGPSIVDIQTLVDEPGVADFDPEPVYVRKPARTEAPEWAQDETTGVLLHQGLAVIDALLTNLHPSGTKPLRSDFTHVRVIEGRQLAPAQYHPIPSEQTLQGRAGSNVSLGSITPARILGEIPLGTDGSFQVELPAGIPFRLQGLDERGMAVGTMHNRWYYLAPGQTMHQGLSSPQEAYPRGCAACHGALDGDPDHVFTDADVLTMASITASRYRDQNPRLPMEPPLLEPANAVEIDFVRDIQPILDRSCAVPSCHSGPEPAASLALDGESTIHYSVAYEQLLQRSESTGNGRYVDLRSGAARKSHLLEKMLGRELQAPRPLQTVGQPHPGPDDGVPELDDDDLRTIIRWLDLGASYRGTFEAKP